MSCTSSLADLFSAMKSCSLIDLSHSYKNNFHIFEDDHWLSQLVLLNSFKLHHSSYTVKPLMPLVFSSKISLSLSKWASQWWHCPAEKFLPSLAYSISLNMVQAFLHQLCNSLSFFPETHSGTHFYTITPFPAFWLISTHLVFVQLEIPYNMQHLIFVVHVLAFRPFIYVELYIWHSSDNFWCSEGYGLQ